MAAKVIYLLFITVFGANFVISLVLNIIVGRALIRPHRSRLFFSYSHKDEPVARELLNRLKEFPLKLWVDFGVRIPERKLRKVLGKLVERRQIFILLASENSATSEWVEFEFFRAQIPEERFGRFRDTVVVAVDDAGIALYEYVKSLSDEVMLHAYLGKEGADKWHEMEPSEKVKTTKFTTSFLEGLSFLPPLRRRFAHRVTLVDMRGNFEGAVHQIRDFLLRASTPSSLPDFIPDKHKDTLKLFPYLAYTAITVWCLLSGLVFLSLLSTYINRPH